MKKVTLEIKDGETMHLMSKQIYIVGNKKKSQYYIQPPAEQTNGCDEKHALLEIGEDFVNLLDLDSTGTYVNGQRLNSLQRKELLNEDKLRFGAIEGTLQITTLESNILNGPKTTSANIPVSTHIVPETPMIEKKQPVQRIEMSADDTCIPETQQLYSNIRSSQKPALSLLTDSKEGELSQFRIQTQDYDIDFSNDISRGSENSDIFSMIIPNIIHSPVTLKSVTQQSDREINEKNQQHNDRSTQNDERNACTPDLFDFSDLGQEEEPQATLHCSQTRNKKDKSDSQTVVTSSDKENINVTVEATAIVDDPASNPPLSLPQSMDSSEENDDELLGPTQVFPLKRNMPKVSTPKSVLSSTLPIIEDKNRCRSGVGREDCATQSNGAKNSECKVNKASLPVCSTSNMLLTSEHNEADIETLMCTPKIIRDQFKETSGEIQRLNVIRKQKLVHNDSDDDDDTDLMQLINNNKSKISCDFDELLPHLHSKDSKQAQQFCDGSDRSKCKEYANVQPDRYMLRKKTAIAESGTVALKQKAKSRERKRHITADETDQIKKLEKKQKPIEKAAQFGSAAIRNKQSHGASATFTPTQELPQRRITRLRSHSREVFSTSTVEQGSASNSNKATQELPQRRMTRLRSHSREVFSTSTVEQGSASNSNKATQELPQRRMTRLQSHSRETLEQGTASSSNKATHELPQRRITRLQSQAREVCTTSTLEQGTASSGNGANMARATTSTSTRSARSLQNASSTEKCPVVRKQSRMDEKLEKHSMIVKRKSSVDDKQQNFSRSTVVRASRPSKFKVSTTMVDPKMLEQFEVNDSEVYTLVKDPLESDILVMDKGARTFKFLVAVAKGLPIVTSKWLECVLQTNELAHFAKYFFADSAFERRHKFNLLRSIELARKQKIFEGFDFLITPGVLPEPNDLKAIIECAGGRVHDAVNSPELADKKLYLISTWDEKKDWHRYRRLNRSIRIINSEGVMASVMRQHIKPLDANIFA